MLEPLFFFSIAIFTISIILYFLREEIFHSWARFTKWYLPLAAILIVFVADSRGGLFIGFGGGFDREGMVWFTAGLFFIISLILIIYKSLKLRRER
ncbi:MAG: hypothetical protein AAB581_03555 [Patescibacteria group bacterium]